MITKVIILSLFLFLHLATGAEITSVQLEHHNLDASEGQQLLIPCFFKVDDPSGVYKIELEWSVKPNGADTFRPIIRLDDTGYLPVSEPNERASINLMQVSKGHCSLVINPVDLNDSGTYQVQIATNGMEKPGTEKVKIRVLKSHGTHDLHSKDTYADRPGTTEVFENPGLIWTEKFLQIIKNKGYLLYLIICGGVVLFLFLLCFVATIVFVCMNWNLGRKITDASKLREEGRMPKKSPDNPDIVIDMDGCNQAMNPTDAPAPTTETIPAAEMTLQGCMPMKLPERKDVVIDMDGCNQLMNPTDAPASTTETIPTTEMTPQGCMPKKSPDNPDIVIDMDRCNQPMNPTDAPAPTTETIPTAEMTPQGCMPKKSPDNPDIVIDMDRCNQPMNPTDAPASTTETIPAAEMTLQGCMPMKLPEKQDVVIDMDGCNQRMQPIGAPDLSLETAPESEMTEEGSMPVKPPEKADVVRDMDECRPMQPTDVTVLPLKTEPQAKRPSTWKRFFNRFKKNTRIQQKEEEVKTTTEVTNLTTTGDTIITYELFPASTSWATKPKSTPKHSHDAENEHDPRK